MLEELLGRVAGRFGRVEPWRRLRGFGAGLLPTSHRENCWTSLSGHGGTLVVNSARVDPSGGAASANAADSAAQSRGLFFSMLPTRVAPIRWTRRRAEPGSTGKFAGKGGSSHECPSERGR
jgi:hypothetical protein